MMLALLGVVGARPAPAAPPAAPAPATPAPATPAPAPAPAPSPPRSGDPLAPSPAPAPPTARTSGPLAAETVRAVVRKSLGAVKRCYDQGLARRPGLGGELIVRFAIQTDGAVSDCQVVRSTLGDAPVERCIAAVVRALGFPKAPRPTVVDYPFVFTTQVP